MQKLDKTLQSSYTVKNRSRLNVMVDLKFTLEDVCMTQIFSEKITNMLKLDKSVNRKK